MGNASKAQTLGMPFGTASGRLRKMILFWLLQKHGEDICFKCKLQIETIAELSIEHKKPWEGVSADLFWDLENIAFSHVQCNRPHRNGGLQLRKIGLEGTAWCSECKVFHPVGDFKKNATRWNGLHPACRTRYNERRKNWRNNNKNSGLVV